MFFPIAAPLVLNALICPLAFGPAQTSLLRSASEASGSQAEEEVPSDDSEDPKHPEDFFESEACVALFGPLKVTYSAPPEEGDLETRVKALETMASQLRLQLSSDHNASVGEFVRLEELFGSVTEAGRKGAPISGFKVGDTSLSIGGFVDLDLHTSRFGDGTVPSSSPFRDIYLPGGIPIGGDVSSATDFTAQTSRLYATATRDFGKDRAMAYIEADYVLSGQGNERVSGSFAQRLRRAFIDFDGWRFGQEWTTFQDLAALPESASLVVLSEGLVFNRQALIRYTDGPWQFALENGNTTVTEADGSNIEADSNVIPDVVARYNLDGDFGHVSLAGIARQLHSQANVSDEAAFGYGLALQGRLKLGKRDQLRFSVAGGQGLGRYVSFNAANAAAVNPTNGDLETINTIGGQLSWRHFITEKTRINVGVGGISIDNPGFVSGATNKSIQSAYAAFLWDIAPQITAGVELLHGIRRIEDGSNGEVTRATFSVQYGF